MSRERTHTGGSLEFVESQQQHVLRSRTWSRDSANDNPSSSPLRRSNIPTSESPSHYVRKLVDWMERQPVPTFLVPAVKRLGICYGRVVGGSTITSSSGGNPNEPAEGMECSCSSIATTSGPIFCVRGLDRVVFGTTAAADCVVVLGIQPPRYLWYMLSGAMCDVFQLLVDITLHLTVFPDDAALCWMISFCVSILARHTSHRYLVFGDYVPNYCQSLGRMYAGYSISIVLSTLFNYVITQGVAKVSHYVAYVFTLLWTGLANYFILKRLWKMGGVPAPPKTVHSAPPSPPRS